MPPAACRPRCGCCVQAFNMHAILNMRTPKLPDEVCCTAAAVPAACAHPLPAEKARLASLPRVLMAVSAPHACSPPCLQPAVPSPDQAAGHHPTHLHHPTVRHLPFALWERLAGVHST